jgi:hypothetical protein
MRHGGRSWRPSCWGAAGSGGPGRPAVPRAARGAPRRPRGHNPATCRQSAFWSFLGVRVLDPFWTPKSPKKGRINGNMRWLGYVRLPCGTSLDDVFLGCFWGYPPFCRVRSPFFEGFQKSYKMTPKKTDQKSGFFRKTAISPNTRKGQLCRFWVFPRNFENFARS